MKYIASYNGKGGDITLPKDCYVGDYAFFGNTEITSVTAPCDYYFGSGAFMDCTNLKKVVVKGNAEFGTSSFVECINLKSVSVEGSLINIYGSAFGFCRSLTDFTVKEDKEEFAIGASAFSYCYSLKEYVIPSKCTEIYGEAFLNCFGLEKITVPAGTKFNYDSRQYHMGYYDAAKSEDDAVFGIWNKGVADGKTKVYCDYMSTDSDGYYYGYGLYLSYAEFTPKKLTMIVTKGSDAEAYAKKYGVAYEYASAPVDKLAAPTGLKASKKTAKSITLTWNAVKGAEGYTVYIYNTKTGKYEKYKNVKSNKCVVSGLTNNTSYKFKVAAVDKTDSGYQTGDLSKALSVKTKSK